MFLYDFLWFFFYQIGSYTFILFSFEIYWNKKQITTNFGNIKLQIAFSSFYMIEIECFSLNYKSSSDGKVSMQIEEKDSYEREFIHKFISKFKCFVHYIKINQNEK